MIKKFCAGKDEMREWFENRTRRHIGLVQKYLQKIMDLNLPEIDNEILASEMEHDESKFKDPECDPYVHIAWKYRQQDLGKTYEPPVGVAEKMNDATFHHIKNNKHHPEYWDDKVKIDCLNAQNRDKPSGVLVDATSMPMSYIASMMADWLAMSEERNSNVKDWIKKNVNIRWKFTPEQVALMNRLSTL